jgi:hypothetical protein
MVMKKYELEGKLGEESALIKSGVLRDENPLDLSQEFNEFLLACRHGDLRKCQELINLGVNINGKDKFDYTPLIIVSFLRYFVELYSCANVLPRLVYAGIMNSSSYS